MQFDAHGTIVDTVAEVIKPNDGLGIGAGTWNRAENVARTLAHERLKSDQEVPNTYWRTLIANLTWDPRAWDLTYNPGTWDAFDRADHSDVYREFIKTMHIIDKNGGGPAGWSLRMSTDAMHFAGEFTRVTRNRCFFPTAGGRIGLGPSDTQASDKVCIIFLFPTPYILRREGDISKLVGDSYVHDFMYGQALGLTDAGMLARAHL